MMRKTATTAVSVALISLFSLGVHAPPGANAQGDEATGKAIIEIGKDNALMVPAAAVTPNFLAGQGGRND
jgi:hypothetical protein